MHDSSLRIKYDLRDWDCGQFDCNDPIKKVFTENLSALFDEGERDIVFPLIYDEGTDPFAVTLHFGIGGTKKETSAVQITFSIKKALENCLVDCDYAGDKKLTKLGEALIGLGKRCLKEAAAK